VGEGTRDAQYDLLTAALIGAAIGATATLLIRRGPSGERPVSPLLRGATGAAWARRRGADLVDRIPVERIEHDVREAVGEAQERIDGFVRHELRDLRRAVDRRRRDLGI
jgi:hypothetical protein